MTATGAARAVGPQGPGPSRRRLALFSFHSRQRNEGVIQARLRIKSSPGVFLLLGIFVVIVGAAVAAAGYWPYGAALLGQVGVEVDLGQPQVAGWGLGAKGGSFSSERLKLLGPVLMGVGLFILICANSVLYENRDRETQRLLAQAEADVCTVSASVPVAETPPYGHSVPKHYQWVTPLPAGNLGLRHLGALVGSEPALLRLQAGEGKWADVGRPLAALWAEARPFKKASSPPISLRSVYSGSCSSSELNLTVMTAASLLEPGVSAVSPPPRGGCCEVTAPPRRCYSLGSRTEPRRERGGVLQQASSPHVCLNVPDLCTWSLDEDRASSRAPGHYSWPRLDLTGARRYLKLENKEDSVDRLLGQLEQQYSRQESSYSSGPFQ